MVFKISTAFQILLCSENHFVLGKYGREYNACWVLAGRAEEQKQLGRLTYSLEGKSEIDLKEIGQEDVNWMHKSLRSSRMLHSID